MIDERIEVIERKFNIQPGSGRVSGIIISRVLYESGIIWSIGFGLMNQPKVFVTDTTIEKALSKLQKAIEKYEIVTKERPLNIHTLYDFFDFL